jgi:site-specific DNA-methyltransferase (adenine-specific)
MVSKVLKKMEVLRGFIHIPAESIFELLGNTPLPYVTTLNGNPARIDKYGRLWSSFLKGKFHPGSRIQITKDKEGFHVSLLEGLHEEKKENSKIKRSKGRKEGTETSSFGSPGRFGHDSSKFYNSRLYEGLPKEKEKVIYFENEIHKDFLNKIFCKSSEHMEELPDNSVHLMVTSPPYNVGKEYDKGLTLDEYRSLLSRVFRETYRVLVPGGRACINVANLGRKPYIPLDVFVVQCMLDIGFLMRGEIIWDKGSSAAASTAWGSWCSPSNPTLRDVHEYILVFSKETFSRQNPKGRNSTITQEEFLEWTKSVWAFPAESATRIGHPAPFPVELPLRLIKLYTFEGEVVLDPFIGSGTTAIAALQTNRYYVGYDSEPEYVKLAEKRIKNFLEKQSQIKLAEFLS